MKTLNRSNNTLYYIKVVGISDSNAFDDQKRMGVDMCVVKVNSEEIHNNLCSRTRSYMLWWIKLHT